MYSIITYRANKNNAVHIVMLRRLRLSSHMDHINARRISSEPLVCVVIVHFHRRCIVVAAVWPVTLRTKKEIVYLVLWPATDPTARTLKSCCQLPCVIDSLYAIRFICSTVLVTKCLFLSWLVHNCVTAKIPSHTENIRQNHLF